MARRNAPRPSRSQRAAAREGSGDAASEDEAPQGPRGRGGRRPRGLAGASLPPVGVADVVGRDDQGELLVRLAKVEDAPAVPLAPDRSGPAPGVGDRLLVKFERLESGEARAAVIRRLERGGERVLGVVRKASDGRGAGRGREVRLEPVNRRSKDGFLLSGPETEGLRDGDLVLAEAGGRGGDRYGPRRARVLETVGREDEPRAASLIALHAHAIPTGFPAAAEEEARAATPPTARGREDLTGLALVTIDPVDARDHDDAVFAHADEDPKNAGGHVVWVAIADVAAYVTPGSALDRTAWEKGNSVYFPDRVEPMLPERLSGGLCSLHEGEARACLAVRMTFDAAGRKTAHRFVRGLMRSAASLSYEQAQAAVEGGADAATLAEAALRPLWAAYACMGRGRAARAPLDLDSPERKIEIDAEGRVTSIRPRERLEAHRLIEEMMVQANVCAAETLEKAKSPLLYRVHEAPSQAKLMALHDFLATLSIPWTKGEPVRTDRMNRLLTETRGGPHAEIVNEVVLRTQMQAHYSPDNLGHFGLNLQRYGHFTSPIRRYADLVVHRALIRALGLGEDGLTDRDSARLQETAEHITQAERRAMAAERDAADRYVAAYLAEHVGAVFDGRVTGVTRFGLFVRLAETGADGLVPVFSLGDEYFVHDEVAQALVAERSGERWRLGRRVEVRLREATPVTGGLLFEMLSEAEPRDPEARAPRLGARGRGARGPGARGPGARGPGAWGPGAKGRGRGSSRPRGA